MFRDRVNFVYWIAAMSNKTIGYKHAVQIAEQFSLNELRKLYMLAKSGVYDSYKFKGGKAHG